MNDSSLMLMTPKSPDSQEVWQWHPALGWKTEGSAVVLYQEFTGTFILEGIRFAISNMRLHGKGLDHAEDNS